MNGKLTMSKVKESNKIYKESVEIPLYVGDQEYIVKFYPFFSPEKVHKMFQSVGEFLIKADEEGLKIEEGEFDQILGYFIVREFTDIKFTQSKKAKVVYDEYKEAINSKLFDLILKSVPEESMKYVYDKLFERQEMVAKLQRQFELAQKQLKDYDFKNKEVKDMVIRKSGDTDANISES